MVYPFLLWRSFQTRTVYHQNLSFMDDINFNNYPWGVDMHEEILGKLDRCKVKPIEIRTSIGKEGEESKSNVWCALILHYFSLDHIPASKVDLIKVVSPRC